jgi:hypothetical protein
MKMGNEIRHRLTFGQFKDHMLDEAPDWYLRLIAKHEWVRNNEPVIFEAAKALCQERGLLPEERKLDPAKNQEVRAMLDIALTAAYRQFAKMYHPDRNRGRENEVTEIMATLTDFRNEIRKKIEEGFPD